MIYLNIRPLLDTNFTGIPQTTWHMAKYWLRQPAEMVRFFIGMLEVDRCVVETLVQHRTGKYFSALRAGEYLAFKQITAEDAAIGVAVFPHTREFREKLFKREIQVIHDLTGILTPEFHPSDLVA